MQELNPSPPRSDGSPPACMAPAIPALIVVVQLIGIVVLTGWFSANLQLAGLPATGMHMQPLTAVCCMLLGLAVWATAKQRLRLARVLIALPMGIALAALFEEATGRSLGIDTLLFADVLAHQHRPASGRPGVLPSLAIVLLGLATHAVASRRRKLRRLTITLTCVAIAMAAISGSLVPAGLSIPDFETRRALMSVPTAICVCALALALILLRREYAWPRKPQCGFGAATLQWTLLFSVALPVLSAITLFWAQRDTQLSTEAMVIFLAVVQVTASCILIAWAWLRISRESSARWAISAALDSAPIAITDIEGRILRWSDGCARLYGWSAEQALGLNKHELTGASRIPGRDYPPAHAVAAQETELTEMRADGSLLRVFETRQIVQPRSDQAPMIVLSMTDATARQQAEQAMLASEARLALAVDLHGLGIFEWSSVDDSFRFHGRAEALFGLETGSFEGGIAAWLAHIACVFGREISSPEAWGPGRYGFRLQSQRPDQPAVIEGTVLVHRDPANGSLDLIGIVMDATERERRAEMLESRESELRSILETVPEAMITIDGQGLVRSFSATAEALFGYAAQDVLGRDVRLVLPQYHHRHHHHPHHVAASRSAEPANAGGSSVQDRMTRLTAGRDRQGNEVPVELAVGEANIGNEQISIAFVRDLREQLQTDARIHELREQFLHASRVSAMGEMSAGLAHELNQPLTATANFLGAIELQLQREWRQDQLRRLLRLASQEVLRAGDIIRRMRAFVSKGELDIRAEPLDEMIADTLQLARSRSQAPGVRLQYHANAAAPVILADRIHIQQVLVNLINNAFDAIEAHDVANPAVTITTLALAEGQIMIRVVDNGPGLPDQVISRPFEAFSSTKSNGMGLGLSICRRIVEAHGGSLALRNIEGGGAAVEFTLPTYSELELKAG
ncbi:PAS domain-containing sensor histidine kinase [Novosphingobium clariflavum]|uniref:histidine kinase n=1 Tax=Novosphingobium clariflavum TaxID=2029884 RepID=A0ABV6SCX3_9SPHN|nr:PAS domain S-box protein [Novosphingobium clariflavum]